MPEVELLPNAIKDLRRIGPGPEQRRILTALKALGQDTANLDIKKLAGSRPWLRLRVGDYRVLYWQRSRDLYEVERIVHRRDLKAVAAGLPSVEGE